MVKFYSSNNILHSRIGTLPEKTAYSYECKYVSGFRFKDIEFVFFSEEYQYAGYVQIIQSSGIVSKKYSDLFTIYFSQRRFGRGSVESIYGDVKLIMSTKTSV